MKRIFKIAGVVSLCILVLWTFFFLWQKSRPKERIYAIESVSIGALQKSTVATGKVEPRNEILVKPQMSGIITDIYKRAGDKVQSGDIIAKIKVIPDMVSLSGAESRLSRAKISFEQTGRSYERDKKLFESSVISKEEFEKIELQYNTSKEELKAASDNLSLIRDGITTSTAALSNTLVRSTISGTILDIPIKVGNSVIQSNNFNDGTTIATIANLGDMLFIGKIDETEVGKLKIGMPIDITIGAEQDKKIEAILEYVSPKGKEENGAILFEIKAALNIPSDIFIRAGYSANANIILAKRDSALTIPEGCIEFSKDTSFVYMLTSEKPQTFKREIVKTGLSDGIRIEIIEGLKDKERIRGAEITK